MTREQYLMMRENQNFNIVYEYYRERFDQSKHYPLLSINELVQILTTFSNINQIFDTCCRHYDEKFAINILRDKDGNIIKVL